ncbi:MAG TPA: L-histidine N(alpha)-methyltransferase [Candidatus Saccharimonadales bacterium]
MRNWIDSAKAGKLDLTLQTKGERTYIANTSKNQIIIRELVDKGKKYRPHRSQKTVMPTSKFYELYTQEQLYDIVSNLEINREIPSQYNYFGEGASNWDKYVQHLSDEESRNNLNATIALLETNQDYLDELLAQYDQINIVDVGVGNALPVRKFVEHLLEIGKMGRYIGIDISETMLEIAASNMKKWFGDKVVFEPHTLDIDHDRFGYLLAEEYIKTNSQDTANILLFLGCTIQNFKKPGTVLKVIHDSMGVKDYLIHQQKLDTQSSRRYFDFNPGPSNSSLAPIDRHIFDLLNIDESLYEVEMGFDPKLKQRYIRVVLKVAVSIRFRFKDGERVVDFNKDDVILLWRALQNSLQDVVDQLVESDLYPLQVSQTDDQEFLLAVSRIRHD